MCSRFCPVRGFSLQLTAIRHFGPASCVWVLCDCEFGWETAGLLVPPLARPSRGTVPHPHIWFILNSCTGAVAKTEARITGTGTMTLHQTVIGCDVSKSRLDLFDNDSRQFSSINNHQSAIAQWADSLEQRPVLVVFEATGGFDRMLLRQLDAHNIRYARVNPARARDFARASGVLAKTDRLDAKVLARMGTQLGLQPDAIPSPQRLEIAELSSRRGQLVESRKQEKTRAHLEADDHIKRSLERHIAWLNGEIARFDQAIAAKIKACEQIRQQVALLTSIPGIGAVTATILVALLPELGTRSRRTIAALAGLAPINHDSGRFRGQRRIRGGRRRVRDALYMAALSSSRSCQRFKAFYQERLKTNPKAKPALIALARKILTIANSVIRDQKPFTA